MKSTNPERRPCRGFRFAATGAACLGLSVLAFACPAAAEPPRLEFCAAARDRALQALAEEAIAITSALDTDAAVADAPEYELAEARAALLATLERERAEAEARYRRCRGEP